jgi:hypothetical protein
MYFYFNKLIHIYIYIYTYIYAYIHICTGHLACVEEYAMHFYLNKLAGKRGRVDLVLKHEQTLKGQTVST